MRALFESCVDSLDAARVSADGGAGRIELCANLDLDGTTPAMPLLERCVQLLSIPVFAIVRPRGGSFVHDAAEVASIARDIRAAKAAGAAGVVFGVLTKDGAIDRDAMQRLLDVARPLPVTCHRAIDASRDLLEALEVLLELGVDRVLTSGGAPTAAAGAGKIREMVVRAGDDLVVMAGGKVRASNVADLIRRTGVKEVHARLLRGSAASWKSEVGDFVAALSV